MGRRTWVLAAWLLVAGCEDETEPTTTQRGLREAPPTPAESPAGSTLPPDADPGRVDDALIGHVQREEYREAYDLTSKGYQQSVPFERFREAVSRNEYLRTTTLIGCFSTNTLDGAVHVRECVLNAEAGQAHAMLYYSREAAGWRMTGMLIGGTPAFPGPDASAVPAEEPPEEPDDDVDAPEEMVTE